ncbi:MAG: uridine kinase [Trueperaceae bacterium]|nr:MAG: uridine kinase [Trueperaceae bacterium]
MPKPLVIGLAGGTGSGKTTVANAIENAAGPANVLILPQDAYYRSQSDLPYEARVLTNYDEPSAFDNNLLVSHIDHLMRGRSIDQPVYDFAQHDRSDTILPTDPKPVVVVEGILVLHEPTLRERMLLKIFVDAPSDERFIRRLERDVKERDRSAESVICQYRRTVKPMHDLFVEPTKQHADLIIPEGGNNLIALDVLSAFVTTFLNQRLAHA